MTADLCKFNRRYPCNRTSGPPCRLVDLFDMPLHSHVSKSFFAHNKKRLTELLFRDIYIGPLAILSSLSSPSVVIVFARYFSLPLRADSLSEFGLIQVQVSLPKALLQQDRVPVCLCHVLLFFLRSQSQRRPLEHLSCRRGLCSRNPRLSGTIRRLDRRVAASVTPLAGIHVEERTPHVCVVVDVLYGERW